MGERTAVFYACQDFDEHDPFNRVAAFAGLNDLADDEWRVPTSGEGDMAVLVDQVGDEDTRSQIRILRIRSDAPFILSEARDLTPVEVAADESVTEFTHAVLFRDGFMGALTSRDAPRHKWLSYYLQEASDQYVNIVNLYRADVVQRLRRLRAGGLTKVKVRVQMSEAEQILEDESLRGFRNIFNAGRQADAAYLTIDLNVGRYKTTLSDTIASETQELADHVDLLEQMVVVGKDEEGVRDEIDMKRERIAWTVQLPDDATDQQHYNAIRRARRDLRPTMGPLGNAARGS